MGRVSIVIPTLNEASNIARTLFGISAWRDQGHEVIVVDGYSEDATASVAEPLCDRVVQSPAGRASQMNAGAAVASGDLLLFLHADTTLPDPASVELNRVFERAECWGRFNVRLDAEAAIFRVIEYCMNWRSRLTNIATGDQAIFVSRGLFERSGGFPQIALMEDIAMSAKLSRIARPIVLQCRVTSSARRWQQNGVLRTIVKMWCLRAAFFFGVSSEWLRVVYEHGRSRGR